MSHQPATRTALRSVQAVLAIHLTSATWDSHFDPRRRVWSVKAMDFPAARCGRWLSRQRLSVSRVAYGNEA